MALIKTLEEAVRERMHELTEAAAGQFSEAIQPIYRGTEKGLPEQTATCTLLHFGDHKYLATAAHVVDENTDNGSTLYVGGAPGGPLIEINGEFWITQKPRNDRNNDRYDFAVWRMPETVIDALGNVTYYTDREIGDDRSSPTGRIYLMLGYPNSKNKKVDVQGKGIKPTYSKYTGIVKANPELTEKLGISGEDHLFLGFDEKHSKDSEGKIVNSINAHGLSGGALIDLGSLAAPDNFDAARNARGRLAGILIEHQSDDKAIVAVKMGVILGRLGIRF
jgi:hypothetical protein